MIADFLNTGLAKYTEYVQKQNAAAKESNKNLETKAKTSQPQMQPSEIKPQIKGGHGI